MRTVDKFCHSKVSAKPLGAQPIDGPYINWTLKVSIFKAAVWYGHASADPLILVAQAIYQGVCYCIIWK